MFKKLFGKNKEVNKDSEIFAPLTGEYVKIEDIPDRSGMSSIFTYSPVSGAKISLSLFTSLFLPNNFLNITCSLLIFQNVVLNLHNLILPIYRME